MAIQKNNESKASPPTESNTGPKLDTSEYLTDGRGYWKHKTDFTRVSKVLFSKGDIPSNKEIIKLSRGTVKYIPAVCLISAPVLFANNEICELGKILHGNSDVRPNSTFAPILILNPIQLEDMDDIIYPIIPVMDFGNTFNGPSFKNPNVLYMIGNSHVYSLDTDMHVDVKCYISSDLQSDKKAVQIEPSSILKGSHTQEQNIATASTAYESVIEAPIDTRFFTNASGKGPRNYLWYALEYKVCMHIANNYPCIDAISSGNMFYNNISHRNMELSSSEPGMVVEKREVTLDDVKGDYSKCEYMLRRDLGYKAYRIILNGMDWLDTDIVYIRDGE